jgi:hypothetical protein
MKLLAANCEGYPVFYTDAHCSILCADCATVEWNNKETGLMETDEPAVHWEGDALICDNCGAEIESAYGPIEK